MITRAEIQIKGIVQGVGFRPFVYQLAQKHQLSGQVFNNASGVKIEVEGTEPAVSDFLRALEMPPPLARIEEIELRGNLQPVGYTNFSIAASASEKQKTVLISPDVATCADCLKELFDPSDRRYLYPFINCTNCGPRFTIIHDVPYDREKTTMQPFTMCELCNTEYHDPENRRFHAQPNACPECGPELSFVQGGTSLKRGNEALLETVARITHGEIVAIKGIGGFHLACDATNTSAVQELRRRKFREDKPFALMASNLDMIRRYCDISEAEEALLLSAARPIVLTKADRPTQRPAAREFGYEAIAPRQKSLGFMLPYSPLHHLLLHELNRPLVLTSANVSDEPIAYRDQDALERLSVITNAFLLHNRKIETRCDDSVVRTFNNRPYFVRRSRGFAPEPLNLHFEFNRQILACGAELKNTFCLTRAHHAFISHHIGDLENLQTLQSFTEGIEHFCRLYDLHPEVIAYDLHPEYLSTKYALDRDSIPFKIGVQHHHAHVVSCMADNGIGGEVIGVAMDGLGYGTDGKFWGCEFMVANPESFERHLYLQYIPMPGGAKAIREPWRMASAYLNHVGGNDFNHLANESVTTNELKTVQQMILQNINSPLTSSMGRCFDAVATLLGIRHTVNYEGQAAVELEMLADDSCNEAYDFELDYGEGTIKLAPVINRIIRDLSTKTPKAIISTKFHNAVAELILRASRFIQKTTGLNRVVLSGGVFQNQFLLKRAYKLLSEAGFDVYTHHRVPTNDGGISLGQAVIANARITSGANVLTA